MTKNIIAISVLAAFASGCATDPEDLSTSYVSAAKYESYNCGQVNMEMDHVSTRTEASDVNEPSLLD